MSYAEDISTTLEGHCPRCQEPFVSVVVVTHPDNDEWHDDGIWRVEHNDRYLPSIVCGPEQHWPSWARGKKVHDFIGIPVVSVEGKCENGHNSWVEQNYASDWG